MEQNTCGKIATTNSDIQETNNQTAMNKLWSNKYGSVEERKDSFKIDKVSSIKKEFDFESLDSLKEEKRFSLRTRLRVSETNHNKIKNKRLRLENHDDGKNHTQIKRIRKEEGCSPPQDGEQFLNNNSAAKLIIYNINDFLAVRNEDNSFFLCRAKQNIYKNGRKIKIQWYNNDENPEVYCPDFYDYIDFECILTNLRVNRLEKKGEVSLPLNEKNRAFNILERALNVEKGINEPPDPHKVLSDGLDISIIGKIKEEDVLSKINHDDFSQNISSNQESIKNPEPSSLNDTKNGKNEQNERETNARGNRLNNRKSSLELSAFYSENCLPRESQSMQNGFHHHPIKNLTQDKEDESSTKEKDVMFETKTTLPFISSHVNSKLLIRVVLLEDHEFLEKLIEKNHLNICSISLPRSVSIKRNPIHYAIIKEDLKSIKLLNEIEKVVKIDEHNHLPYSMELYHSELMMDEINYKKQDRKEFPLNNSYAKFTLKQGVKFDFITKIIPFFKNGLEDFSSNIITLLKSGNHDLALSLTRKICGTKNDSKYEIFHKILSGNFSPENDLDSLELCVDQSLKLYPIHLAAINPDPYFFHALINISSNQIYMSDYEGWMPIHYTSVCQSFFNIHHLLNLGVSTRLTDSKGNTPLHLATKNNRIHNVALIIRYESSQSLNSSLFNSYNHKGFTPLHIACQKGFNEVVSLFIENHFQIDFVTSNHSGELTPLMIASKHGHLDIVKMLVENGANINIYDKKNRSALTYAVINGHSNIVIYFLDIGANPSGKDLFGNNLFHYALAYGWHSCYELLLKTNINLKDTNTFGLTPIYAAFMKGHVGFIEYILKKNILNVNVPVNDTGINLVMLTFSMVPSSRSVDYLKLFVEKFKCDLSKTDYEGNNTLHYLLKCEAKHRNSGLTVINAIQNALTIVLQNGCDIYLNNHAGISPITFSLLNQCFISFSRFFKDHHKSNRFQRILSTSEFLWPIIISNVLNEFIINKGNVTTFGRYFITVVGHDKNFCNLLKSLSLKTNISGDLPVEYFIKISKHLLPTDTQTTRMTENKLIHFFDFLIQFYEREFLEDIFILHLAAKFGSSFIIKQLLDTIVTKVDVPNEFNQTPFAIALINDNISAAEIFLKLKININFKIENTSCFFYYLKKTSSLCLIPLFITCGIDIKQPDNLGNTALHLICENVDRNNFIESVKIFIEQGIDVNTRNFQDETALHVAFKMNRYSSRLCELWNILMKNEIDVYVKDQHGYNAFNYLFLNDLSDKSNLINLIKQIDLNRIKCQLLSDRNQVNLLHYSAKMGLPQCIIYLLSYIDPNIVDVDNYSPLSLAILNGHRDCTLILLKSDKIRILDNLEIISKKNIKINLLWHIWKNEWKDAFFIIEEKAIRQNELNELIQILIKSQCLEYALYLMRSNAKVAKNSEYFKTYLLLFGKYSTVQIPSEIQHEFLLFFKHELISLVFAELFSSAFSNWNYKLCLKLIDSFSLHKIVKKLKEKNIDLISLSFKKLIYEDRDLPDEMKNLIELIVQKEAEHEINVLSNYPIEENKDSIVQRYRFFNEHEQNKYSTIQYSPLIIAIIRKCHSTVKWLLKLQINKKYIVDIDYADSQERIPMIHAILNNDLRMIKLLLDPYTHLLNDYDIWNNTPQHYVKTSLSTRIMKILKRDVNNLTVFHYLISPFEFGNFYKSDVIYSILWNMLDNSQKTSELINELYKYASEKKAFQILHWMEKTQNISSIQSHLPSQDSSINSRSMKRNENDNKNLTNNFRTDYDTFIQNNTFADNTISDLNSPNPKSCQQKKIIKDHSSNIPFDVTFTKLDNHDKDYIYNFYKVQLLSVGNKYCLLIRWGRVGTQGNIKKLFYDSKRDGIDNFKKIFANKSGENWTQVNFYVTQDKYRVVTSDIINGFDSIQKRWSFRELLEKLYCYESSCQMNHNFKKLILKFIYKLKIVENKLEYSYENLSTKSMERCSFILNRLSKLIVYNNFNKIKNQKENLKLLNDMIDLSEQFYAHIKIFGNEFDRLKPILNIQDIREKSDLIKKLKSVVFSMEFLFFVLNTKNINPWDYINSSLKWQCQIVSTKEEIDFIKSYLYSSIPDLIHDNRVEFTIFKINNQQNINTKKDNTYLLWYHLKNYEFFDFFLNGFESQFFLLQSDPQIIMNGICLTNRIIGMNGDIRHDDNDNSCWVLCEALIENPLEIHSISDRDIKNYESLFQNRDCIIINNEKNSKHKNYLQDYLYWRGSIVPIYNPITDGPNQFIHLSPSNQMVLPRYIVDFKQKSISSL